MWVFQGFLTLRVEDVNWKRPKDGNTALHLAAEMGHTEVQKMRILTRRTIAVGSCYPPTKKTNISTENGWLEEYFPFGKAEFQHD